MSRRHRLIATGSAATAALCLTGLLAGPAGATGVPSGEVHIRNSATGFCLDISEGRAVNGNSAVISRCTNFNTQYWTYIAETYQGHRVYEIKSYAGNKCLEVRGSARTDEAGVDVSTCDHALNQYWTQATNAFDGGQDITSSLTRYGYKLVPHINSDGTASEKVGAGVEVSSFGGDIDNSWYYQA